MKSILFYSPDLNLCASLLMFFNDTYSVTTTTDLAILEKMMAAARFDLLVIDAEPNEKIERLCRQLHESAVRIPVIITYVYTIKYKERESILRNYIEAVFYKPIDLLEVSQKINRLMRQYDR